MTAEEAKKILDDVLNKETDGYMDYLASGGKTDGKEEDYFNALDCAVEALEKQIPKKPHRKYPEIPFVLCKCGEYIGIPIVEIECGTKYCGKCGTKIDWSDEK